MKILYFSFVELDVPNACQTHTLGVLSGFSANQCIVHAIVPRPIYVRPKIPNIRFYYIWPWRFSIVGKTCFAILAILVMFFLCLRNKFNAIYVREMEQNPGPRLCSKLFKIPLYMEINDLIVPVLTESKVNSNIIRKVARNQKLDFNQAAGLIVPSVPMCKWIINEHRLPASKVHLIFNGTENSNGCKFNKLKAREELGLDKSCFCLVFIGNIYKEYDFNTILRGVVECKPKIPMIRLLIVGDGPLTAQIMRQADELGIKSRIIFTGYIPHEKLGKIIPAADVGLLIRTKKGSLRYGPISTKLSTYAFYELPVIATGKSLENYPNELVRSICLVPPEDHYALANKIIKFFKNPDDRKQKAKILNNYAVENLTWNAVAKKTLGIIRSDISLT